MKPILSLLAVALLALSAMAEPPRLKVPSGFEVAEIAGPDLANDIYGLHIDADGRIVVAGRGFVRQIVDSKIAIDLVSGIKDGPMGLLWEGETLYVVVDGGLKRYSNVTGRETSKAPPQLIFKIKTGGEHDSHAVRRGPDGKLDLLCGNNSDVNAKTITSPNSPIKNPVAGALLRMDDDGSNVEVFADGLRNAYDFDFDLGGAPHTFDSDNERCVGLPWYEHTRFYRIAPGSNFGWLNPQFAQTWRKPPYFPDVAKPLATVGRGSPTGCICYRHTGFPERYRGGFFLADWTFGNIWFVPAGGEPELFLEPLGDSGFAPTGLAVHPKTGDLYVSIGGRGTRGGVYRISPKELNPNAKPIPIQSTPMKPFPTLAKPESTDFRSAGVSLIRSWQVELGDLVDPKLAGTVWEGYSFRKPVPAATAAKLLPELRAAYPHGSGTMNRELTRTLAALGDPDPATVAKVVQQLSQTSKPIDDVHHLIVLSRLTGARTESDRATIADAIVRLDAKFEQEKIARDRHWPLRLAEAVGSLLKIDPMLEASLLAHSEFGQSAHAWLAKLVDRPKAARRILDRAKREPEFEWSPALVELLGALDENDFRPLIPLLIKRGGLNEALISLVSKSKRPDDRELFAAGLQSFQPRTLALSANALAAYSTDERELVPALQALRRLGDTPGDTDAKKSLVVLLQMRTGQKYATAKEWEAWFVAAKPALAKLLASGGFDAVAWKARAAKIEWDAGDEGKGRAVFAKANCAACHNGAQAIGPSLEGVTKRFGRDDLLTAIVDPNRDVSARYRTTEIQTRDGKTHRGVVIYEAVDGVMLHTGTAETVRVAGDNIESKRTRETSLMPVGLLDSLADRDVADLVAYLKTLQPAK